MKGPVRLKDAGDALGRSLEHPEVQMISGLVLALLGRPAALGDVVTWNDVRVEVTATAGRGVHDAALTVAAPGREGPGYADLKGASRFGAGDTASRSNTAEK